MKFIATGFTLFWAVAAIHVLYLVKHDRAGWEQPPNNHGKVVDAEAVEVMNLLKDQISKLKKEISSLKDSNKIERLEGGEDLKLEGGKIPKSFKEVQGTRVVTTMQDGDCGVARTLVDFRKEMFLTSRLDQDEKKDVLDVLSVLERHLLGNVRHSGRPLIDHFCASASFTLQEGMGVDMVKLALAHAIYFHKGFNAIFGNETIPHFKHTGHNDVVILEPDFLVKQKPTLEEVCVSRRRVAELVGEDVERMLWYFSVQMAHGPNKFAFHYWAALWDTGAFDETDIELIKFSIFDEADEHCNFEQLFANTWKPRRDATFFKYFFQMSELVNVTSETMSKLYAMPTQLDKKQVAACRRDFVHTPFEQNKVISAMRKLAIQSIKETDTTDPVQVAKAAKEWKDMRRRAQEQSDFCFKGLKK